MESNYYQQSKQQQSKQSTYQVKRKQQQKKQEHHVHPISFARKHKKEIRNVARGAARKVAKYAKFI